MNGKVFRIALLCAFCALLAAYQAPLGAILTGNTIKVSSLATLSGGRQASSSPISIKAINIGGLADSGVHMTGGNINMSIGETPAVITFATAKNDLSNAHCYPVPFKPSAGHTKITFTALTRYARVRIYTLSGVLVRTLSKSDNHDSLEWNVRNDDGAPLASGVYIFIVDGAVKPKKGKLMIIR